MSGSSRAAREERARAALLAAACAAPAAALAALLRAADALTSAPAGPAAGGEQPSGRSPLCLLPPALAYSEPSELLDAASRPGGAAPGAGACGAVYALWVAALLRGEGMDRAWAAAVDRAGELPGRRAELPDGTWKLLREAGAGGPVGPADSCAGELAAAAACCLEAGGLEAALAAARGMSENAAAAAAAAAGACWGAGAIGEERLAAIPGRRRLERAAARLAGLAKHREIYARARPFVWTPALERIWVGRNPLSALDAWDLLDLGITHVLDLRQEFEWRELSDGRDALATFAREGVSRRSIPIRDATPPAPEHLAAACAFLEDALADPGARVYVHCRGGRERAASILLAYLARRDRLPCAEALARLQAGCSHLHPLPEQVRAVRVWLECAAKE